MKIRLFSSPRKIKYNSIKNSYQTNGMSKNKPISTYTPPIYPGEKNEKFFTKVARFFKAFYNANFRK